MAHATAGALPDVYDGRNLPGSRAEAEIASDNEAPPWQTLAGGIFLIVVAFYLNGAFTELATGARESVSVWWGIAVLYNLLGPKVTVALLGLAGGIMTIIGLRKLI